MEELNLHNPIAEYLQSRPEIRYFEDLQRSDNAEVKRLTTEIINLYLS